MTDYSELTDDHINEAVYDHFCDRNLENGEMRFVHEPVPDYCNDWAAIGGIIDLIVAEKVTLAVNFGGLLTSALGREFNGRDDIEVDCGNLKRAYAICFLMMQDAKG